MRLWSLHPRYLDARGLTAVWREGLLAQKVLQGRTRGYRHHPQLARFRAHPEPVALVATYLSHLAAEAQARGYSFDTAKIDPARTGQRVSVTRGQMAYEWAHLLAKLEQRDPKRAEALQSVAEPEPHPIFFLVAGEVEPWEKR
jgi:hypothetical protein